MTPKQRVRVRLEVLMHQKSVTERTAQGDASGDALRALVRAGHVDIQPSGDHSYDRIVARVVVGGHDIAHALVRNGMAWDSTKYDRSGVYAADQLAARQANAGIWSQANPTPPWQWQRTAWH